MEKKYTSKQITELAKVWYNDRTTKNANAVLIAIDRLLHWHVSRRHPLIDVTRVEKDDLVQEARLGVMRALEKYDGERGFTAYATFWIKQRVGRHIYQELHLVKYPGTAGRQKLYHSYGRLMNDIRNEDCNISLQDAHMRISKMEGIPIEDIEAHYDSVCGYKSLDQKISLMDDGESGSVMMDFLVDDHDPETSVITEIDRKKCLSVVKSITDRMSAKKRDIAQRYIVGETDDTQISIAHDYGVTRQSIQQIEKTIRPKLIRQAQREMGLR